jgi:hypothetical protein
MLGVEDRRRPGEFWNVEYVTKETCYRIVGLLHFVRTMWSFSRRKLGIGAIDDRGNTLRGRAIHGG